MCEKHCLTCFIGNLTISTGKCKCINTPSLLPLPKKKIGMTHTPQKRKKKNMNKIYTLTKKGRNKANMIIRVEREGEMKKEEMTDFCRILCKTIAGTLLAVWFELCRAMQGLRKLWATA